MISIPTANNANNANKKRSDDFIDGLQVAYKTVYALLKQCKTESSANAIKLALSAIDDCINNELEEKPLLILPCST